MLSICIYKKEFKIFTQQRLDGFQTFFHHHQNIKLSLSAVCLFKKGKLKTEILRFAMEIFVYKWFHLIIKEIISRN